MFSEVIDSGAIFHVLFKTDFYGLPKTYSLFEKKYSDPKTASLSLEDSSSSFLSQNPVENLSVSGYKSLLVSMGSFGEVNLEQGLDVRIGGEIRPGTEINAHLSDQGSTLDGATREISEFDMIYVTLTDPLYNITVGDQYMEWPFKGILSGQKKIKGISASLTPRNFQIGAFGALSGGTFTIENFKGQNGIQGPYYLKGKGEAGLITPVGGTVRIEVNGKTLEEGEDKDFTVDYDLGTFTFNPKLLIKDEDLIRVEYEYKMFDYQRVFSGATAGYSTPDSSFSVKGVLWSEYDNKNHPIDLDLSAGDKASLAAAGDSPPFGSTAQLLNRNDVPTYDAVYALYKKVFNSSGKDSFFVHKRYDPFNRADIDSFYLVWFRDLGDNQGDYVSTDSTVGGDVVYSYAGPGKGNFSPTAPLPAPKRTTNGEVMAKLSLPYLKSTVNVAGQEFDKNLFSSRDDGDNLGSQAYATLLAGNKDYKNRSLWTGGDYRYISKKFNGEALSDFERKDQWDDRSTSDSASERQIWNSFLGTTVLPGVSTELAYGQNRDDSILENDKFSDNTRLSWKELLILNYDISYIRHFLYPLAGFTRKETATTSLTLGNHEFKLLYNDEWREDTAGLGWGLIGGGMEYFFTPLQLRQSFTYNQGRMGDKGLLSSQDTGSYFLYEGSLNRKILPGWTLSGSGEFMKKDIKNRETSTTALVDVNSNVAPEKTGFTSTQHYRTSSEKASRFIQVPVYAGKGLGTYIFDSTLNEYVPHIPGDYNLIQKELTDQASSERIRKTSLEFTWSYHPLKKIQGILRDLYWRGSLISEEHLDADEKGVLSWIPGLYSLGSYFGGKEPSRSSYTDVSYRQELEWQPDSSIKGVSAHLYILPSYKKIRTYIEPGMDIGLGGGVDRKRLFIGDESRWIFVEHDDSASSNYKFSDLNSELTEKIHLPRDFELYLKECAGMAFFPNDHNTQLSLDTNTYYQINPGITWKPGLKGWVDASYTFSLVNLPENSDYRLARGFSAGSSHVFNVTIELQFGNHFSMSGSYRGELGKDPGSDSFDSKDHTVSLEVKAFL